MQFFKKVTTFFSAPEFPEDDTKYIRAKLISFLINLFLWIALLYAPYVVTNMSMVVLFALITVLAISIVMRIFLNKGYVKIVGVFQILLNTAVMLALFIFDQNGLRAPAYTAFVIFFALYVGLVFGFKGSSLWLAGVTTINIIVVYFENQGHFLSEAKTPSITLALAAQVVFGGGAILMLRTMINSLFETVQLYKSEQIKRREIQSELEKTNEELEQRVAERTKQLNSLYQELSSFSYSISHDLRAPLRAISGYTEISHELFSEHQDPDQEGLAYLEKTKKIASEMNDMIISLLKMADITQMERKLKQINLSGMVENILGELQESTPDRKTKFSVQAELTINSDEGLMRILLQNLLSNAWKFTTTREIAEITFGKQEEDGQVLFYVRDNGIGVNSNYTEKMFVPFQKLHSEYEGMGIGLATVQRIINRLEGTIFVESEEDKGLTIFFGFQDGAQVEI